MFDIEAIKNMSLKEKADLLPEIEKAIENARDALAEIATTTAPATKNDQAVNSCTNSQQPTNDIDLDPETYIIRIKLC